jgi:two-component system sensor histidine kinase BaeS
VRAEVRTRDEIGALGRDVNRLAETLEKNRTARRRWMADIAHELRTPVAILKGEIEAIEDGVRPIDEKALASLNEETERLARLIDDLQTLALSDAGALSIHKEELDFSSLVRQAVAAFSDRLAAREIELELQVTDGISLCGDAHRLRQLLDNLLENSCRYVEQGGKVRLVLVADGDTVHFRVEDSGPGLKTTEVEQLFRRFYRVEASRSRSTGGSGLGLAICRNIVEVHQGNITADHSSLGGLEICFELPV